MDESYSQQAHDLFCRGYNCSQAVVGVFAEQLGLELETALKIASPFGGGMGRMREVCGAVSGMFMVLGLARGYSAPGDLESKKRLYSEVRLLAEEFKRCEGSIVCSRLLAGVDVSKGGDPQERTEEYYRKRPCPHLVARAAQIVGDFLDEKNSPPNSPQYRE